MVDTVRFIRLGTVAGGNGTEDTSDPGNPNRAFSNYAEFDAAGAGTDIGAGNEWIARCTGGPGLEDSSDGSVDPTWVVSPGKLTIMAQTGQEAVTPIDTSRYIKSASSSFRAAFSTADINVHYNYLQIKVVDAASGSGYAVQRLSGGGPYVKNSVGYSEATGPTLQHLRGFYEVFRAENCVVFNLAWSTNCVGIRERSGQEGIDNCLVDWRGDFSNVQYAFRGNCTNCAVRGNTDLAFHVASTGTDNCSEVSGDAPVGGGQDNTQSPYYSGATSHTLIYQDWLNNNYKLLTGTIFGDGVGANLSAFFTDDLAGNTRPAGGFSIGPYADPQVIGTIINATTPNLNLATIDADVSAQGPATVINATTPNLAIGIVNADVQTGVTIDAAVPNLSLGAPNADISAESPSTDIDATVPGLSFAAVPASIQAATIINATVPNLALGATPAGIAADQVVDATVPNLSLGISPASVDNIILVEPAPPNLDLKAPAASISAQVSTTRYPLTPGTPERELKQIQLNAADVTETTARLWMTPDERAKLAGIEAGAQVNTVVSVALKTGVVLLDADDIAQTGTRIWYTPAEKLKLDGIEAGAQVNTVTSVNGQTGAVVLDADNIAESATRLWMTVAERTKLGNLSESAQWAENGGNIYRASGNVGIGTNVPAAALDVVGTGPSIISASGDPAPSLGIGMDLENAKAAATGNFTFLDLRAQTTVQSRISTRIVANLSDVADASYSGRLAFDLPVNGSRTTRMVIDGANVGIGASSPSERLHVDGDTDQNVALFESASSPRTDITVRNNATAGASDEARLLMAVTGNDSVSNAAAMIVGQKEQTWTATASTRDASMRFRVRQNNVMTTRMVIGSSGNVGINDTAPTYKLDVTGAGTVIRAVGSAPSGNTPSNTHGEIVVDSTDANIGMELLGGITSNQRLIFSDTSTASGAVEYEHSSDKMHLIANAARRITIDGTGKVGIGTVIPDYRLHATAASPDVLAVEATAANDNLVRIIAPAGKMAEIGLYTGAVLKGALTYDDSAGFVAVLGETTIRAHTTSGGAKNAWTAFHAWLGHSDEFDNGTSGAIDWKNGNHQTITLDGNKTITFTDPGYTGMVTIRLIQDAIGNRTVTWPSSVKASGGSIPPLTTTGNAVDMVMMYFDKTNYYILSFQNDVR